MAVLVGISLFVRPAHADTGDILSLFGYGGSLTGFILQIVSNIFTFVILKIAAWFVALTGTLLNVSMFATTHMSTLVDSSPIIYTVWQIIRDISSLFLIFMILWAAIKMILNMEDANYGDLIKNIVIMGVLINFSFFIARIGIDLSNIVSLQFYNAIAPTNTAATTYSATSGGLSDIFMNSFRIQSWYDGSGALTSPNSAGQVVASTLSRPIKIILFGVGGTIVMLMASLSFLAAAGACLWRLVILIFLLGFSPIWIAAMAIPKLKEASDEWMTQYKTQLLFLPVYLGVMYVAIRILTESKINDISAAGSSVELSQFVNLFVSFAIVIFMINLPFVVALKIAGSGMGWTTTMLSGFNKKLTGWAKGAATGTGNWVGRNTVGRTAYLAGNSQMLKRISGVAPGTGLALSNTINNLSKSTLGRQEERAGEVLCKPWKD